MISVLAFLACNQVDPDEGYDRRDTVPQAGPGETEVDPEATCAGTLRSPRLVRRL